MTRLQNAVYRLMTASTEAARLIARRQIRGLRGGTLAEAQAYAEEHWQEAQEADLAETADLLRGKGWSEESIARFIAAQQRQ